jgi:type III secretion protein T
MTALDLLLRLPQLDHAVSGILTLLAVCSVRLALVFVLFPPTDSSVLQPMIKTGIVMTFATFVTYGQPAALVDDLRRVGLLALGVREAVIGLVIGMAASGVFWTAQGAGAYVDDLTGYNNVQITNPNDPNAFTPTSMLFLQIANAAFWTLGGMTTLLGVVYESYRWWPLDSATPLAANILESFSMHQADSLMDGVARLAAPLMLILLLVDFGLGLVARAAPRLELGTLAQPIKGALIVFVLAQFAMLFVAHLRGELTLVHLREQLHQVPAASAPASSTS